MADVASHSILADWHDVSGAASAAWVPVVRDDRAVGVLAVGWPSVRPSLPERDEELLRLLAAEAAITIHRTDLLARLQSTARTDPLTGLPNRRVWDEDLEREIARARRHGGSLCLAMLDLDRFKAFNDEYGHQAGDQLLAATAAAWRPALRATDTIARYGGEEFAVLLPHSDQEAALMSSSACSRSSRSARPPRPASRSGTAPRPPKPCSPAPTPRSTAPRARAAHKPAWLLAQFRSVSRVDPSRRDGLAGRADRGVGGARRSCIESRRGVYAVGHAALSREGSMLAAVLAAGEGAAH